MLGNQDNSKIKYPSFRIDDILNFGSNDLPSASDYEDKRSKYDQKFEDKFDQPINLSSIKYSKDDVFSAGLPFGLHGTYENLSKNLNENQFQKNKSSVSSSSPTLSVGSSDSPLFNQFSPTITTSKSPIIDQLIKCNLNETDCLKANRSPTCSDESNHNSSFCNSSLPNRFFAQPYSQSIEDFYLKLNKNQFANKAGNQPFAEAIDYDKPIDVSVHNINDTLKKFQQECKFFFCSFLDV